MKDEHIGSMTDRAVQALQSFALPLQDALVIGMVPPDLSPALP